MPAEPTQDVAPYAGLVTRALGFALDALIVNLTGAFVGVIVGLALSIVEVPERVDTVLIAVAAGLFVVWTIAYFVVFWSTTGQTPGSRVMRIRVRQSDGDAPPLPRWALVRLGGLFLAAVPLLLGFLPILLTERRRGLHDWIARTIVVNVTADEAVLAGQVERAPVTRGDARGGRLRPSVRRAGHPSSRAPA